MKKKRRNGGNSGGVAGQRGWGNRKKITSREWAKFGRGEVLGGGGRHKRCYPWPKMRGGVGGSVETRGGLFRGKQGGGCPNIITCRGHKKNR